MENREATGEGEIATPPLRLILVEDSLPVRQRVRSLIEEAVPVEIVGEATTVTEARALFAERKADAVILDLYLADGSGFDLVIDCKRALPDCLLVILTSFAIRETRERCLELGADFFFEKSREFERVPEVLAEWYGRRGL